MIKKWFNRFKNMWINKIKKIPLNYLTILVYVILVIFLISLFLLNLIPLLILCGGLVNLFILIIIALIERYKQKKQTLLISFTVKYLLENEDYYIDEILGTLIAGTWKKLKIDPIEEFFATIKRLSKQSDYEMRRRVAEALPALYQIDLENGKELFKIIRMDWDDNWKSDNRRRAIESLCYLIENDKKFVKNNLHIIDGDEIFTIISLVEILDKYGEKTSWEGIENRFHEIENELVERKYCSDEIESISELWNILDLIRYNPNQAIKKFEDLKDSSNIYVQICIARNLNRLGKRFPERILNLMGYFIHKDKHKNVRRPIAKENSIECLIHLLQDRKTSGKAKKIIWELVSDDDDIIRLATFDKAEKILDVDNEFGKRILEHIVERNGNSRLVERARTLLDLYEMDTRK